MMTLNELIKWARENGVDFDKHIEVGGWDGTGPLTEKMIDKRGDDGIDIDSTEW
jgi:hypothetical protein